MTAPRSKRYQAFAALVWLVTIPLVYLAIRSAMDKKPSTPIIAMLIAATRGRAPVRVVSSTYPRGITRPCP